VGRRASSIDPVSSLLVDLIGFFAKVRPEGGQAGEGGPCCHGSGHGNLLRQVAAIIAGPAASQRLAGERGGLNMRYYVLRIFVLVTVVLMAGPGYAANQLQIAPGEVICRDQQRALEYVQRHADFAPDPAFQCWPLAPFAQVFELQDVVSNVRGRRMVAVQVVQPNFAPFNGYAFVEISKLPRANATPAPATVAGTSPNPAVPMATPASPGKTPYPVPPAGRVLSPQEVARERDACINAANVKFNRGADGPQGSYHIWQVELQRCNDLATSRLVAEPLMKGANCSLKLDWILQYRAMVPKQGYMAEDRYAEYCPTK
jgi:hypothetical protein